MGLIVRVVNNTGPGLALQEMMYGFIMALLFITATRFGVIECNSAIDLIVLMAGMDFTWGAIDCILFYFVDVLDQRRMLGYMSSDLPLDTKAELMSSDFDGSPLDIISNEQRLEACKRIALLDLENEEELRKDRRRMARTDFYCFVATVLPLIPLSIPLLFIDDLVDALFVASAMASITLFFVGWKLGKYVGMKGWVLGSIIAGISWAITLIATFTGG